MNTPHDFTEQPILVVDDEILIKINGFCHFIILTDEIFKLPARDFLDFLVAETNAILTRHCKLTGDWFKAKEACEALQVDPSTLRDWANNGKITYKRTAGGHRRYLLTQNTTEKTV